MRILFDSKKTEYKSPFGCLMPGQTCLLTIRIPVTVKTTAVQIVLEQENGELCQEFSMSPKKTDGAYDFWQGKITLGATGLFFYHFRITGHTGTFRLFKYGDDTNMEAGDKWQLSCIPGDFTTPDWAKGAVIYQIFPDRFRKSGDCNLTGKQTPYVVHENWNEEVFWQPNEKGEVLNNDFFGGNFRGITEKMDYIASLGTTILYLNPISKSFSSHRYDTGDYRTPDPMLGTVADFKAMCEAAHKWGIRVVLDGVYSHTGSDSLYFDKKGTFGGNGAYNSKNSPYFTWYRFRNYPDSYDSWWGFDTLPTVNKLDPAFIEYIITGRNSVVAHWLSLGADGFRLDVADELPDAFIAMLKKRIREIKPDALLMGEVWEDASNKIAYDVRRRYFVDGELDSIMNYPFRTAILNFLRGADGGDRLKNTVMTLLENYPRQVALCNMNLLGTHDTPRILTALVDDFDGSREQLAQRSLSTEQLALAKKRLMLATVLQFCLPGSPSIYYGDEALMQGGKDPFNRRTYPWGREDAQLLEHFRMLGQLRKKSKALQLGDAEFYLAADGEIGFYRTWENQRIKIYVNRNTDVFEITEESNGK
jgi:glycosidase